MRWCQKEEVDETNYLDFYYEDFTAFFIPSRMMWKELGDVIKKSDNIVFLQKDENRLEKMIFRKV